MPRSPFAQRLKRTVTPPKAQDDHSVQQTEAYYKKLGYHDESIEDKAADDFELAQRLNKKKRGLRGVMLGTVDN